MLQQCLNKLLLMGKLDAAVQRKVVQEMYERKVTAGEILIKEGDTGEQGSLSFYMPGVPLLSAGVLSEPSSTLLCGRLLSVGQF